jgi:hypothetical protein
MMLVYSRRIVFHSASVNYCVTTVLVLTQHSSHSVCGHPHYFFPTRRLPADSQSNSKPSVRLFRRHLFLTAADVILIWKTEKATDFWIGFCFSRVDTTLTMRIDLKNRSVLSVGVVVSFIL